MQNQSSTKILVLIGFILFTLAPLRAALITTVNVETFDGESYPLENVLLHIDSQPGTTFSQGKLSNDIQQLYQTGYFEDIGVNVETTPEGEIILNFTVEPVPRIVEIRITGNDNIKTRQILGEITVEEDDLLDPVSIADSTTAIRGLYEQKKYFGTTIDSQIEKIDKHSVVIIWRIDEEPRSKIRRVRFVGSTLFSDRRLSKAIENSPSFWRHIFPTGFYNEQQLEIDKMRLQRLYTGQGYLDFEVTEVRRRFSDDRKWVSLIFFLDEGLPYVIGSVAIDGNNLFGDDELKRYFSLEQGMLYNPALQSKDIESIRDKYAPLGYVDLETMPQLEMDHDNQVVDVTYRIREGQSATIRDVRITGNEITRDEVIRRELLLHPGDLANSRKIEASRSVIQNLNYFETVSVTPLGTERPDRKDLHIHVQEKPTGQLMAGAGFSTEDALIGTLQITQTNFDLTNWPSFRGGGQRMQLQLQVGTRQNNVLVSFTEPWWLDRRLRLNLSGYLTTRDEGEYDREVVGLGSSLAWQGWGGLRHQAGLRLENVRLRNFSTGVSPELAAEEGTYQVTALQYDLSHDTRDRFIYPTRGYRWELSSVLQPKGLGSYSDVYRLGLNASAYSSLLKPFIVRLKGEIGVVDSFADGDDVAIFDRYFAGGASTFRGFKRRDVSPVDINEEPLGGKSILLGTVELIYPFTDNVRASIFSDMGNVWADSYDWDPSEINMSVGIGIEMRLPIGPIRLDYGFPIVTEQEHLSTSGRLHFNLGYQF